MRPFLLSALFLIVASNSFAAESSSQIISKKQVYELFVQKTGLELKDLVSAVKGDTTASKKIQKFSLKQNSDSVLASVDKQIEKMKADCSVRSLSPSLCNEQAAEFSKGMGVHELNRKALSGELTSKTLQWHLMVVSYVVDEQVLDPLMKTWTSTCEKPGKLNTPECKASLGSMTQFQELVSNILGRNLKNYASSQAPSIKDSSLLEAVAAYGK